MNCTPHKKNKVHFEQIQKSIDQIVKNYSVRLVVFTGGESTLLGEDLFRAIRYCTLNFLRTRLVTNAHWATSLERAQRYVEKFRNAGLSEMNISVDDYHEPYVSLENIRNAWLASKEAGFEAVVLANSHGNNDKITPSFIQEFLGEKITVSTPVARNLIDENTPLEKRPRYEIYENTLQKSGRAESLDDNKFNTIDNLTHLDNCCTWAVSDPVLSPLGHIWACCGIPSDNNPILDLGDANKEKIKTILTRASKNPILNAIHEFGPLKLCKFVEEHSKIRFKKDFCGVCEICSALTNNKKAVQVLLDNEKLINAMLKAKRSIDELSKVLSQRQSNN
jgi:MoaA/NifB/PqqE/SkfB family radical SAM enzyme